MKQFIDLLVQYWKPIAGLLFLIVGFICALIRKKPINDILTDIYTWSVLAVIDTEKFSKDNKIESEVKLARAVEFVFLKLKEKYPTINANKYTKVIIYIIEVLLSTPHKKG